MKKVVLTTLPLSKKREDVFALAQKDRALASAIIKHSKGLTKKGIETFKREGNIIATETGYFLALWEDDPRIQDIPKLEGKIEPFMGLDGRLKFEMIDKDGTPRIEDLAHIVAKLFVPNPDDFEYVFFKDGNPQNCHSENLYWAKHNIS